MLFGNKKIQDAIIRDAEAFAVENDLKLIYGAMVGGCSRGTHYSDSDYDTRFLYVQNDFPEKIIYPFEIDEKYVIKRKYFDENSSPYEWIPLWEATSFFQYLCKPYIEGRLSYGLYYTVGWTMNSPYTWDPYGLQMKLAPFIKQIFRKDYAERWHLSEIEKWFTKDHDMVIKNYLYSIYAAASIDWIEKYDEFNPINIHTLFSVLPKDSMRTYVFQLLELGRKLTDEKINAMKSSGQYQIHQTHFHGEVEHNAEIDEYIEAMRVKASNVTDINPDMDKINATINSIYSIINSAVYDEKELKRGWLSD